MKPDSWDKLGSVCISCKLDPLLSLKGIYANRCVRCLGKKAQSSTLGGCEDCCARLTALSLGKS